MPLVRQRPSQLLNGLCAALNFTGREYAASYEQSQPARLTMNDLIYIGITVLFFLVGGLYVRGCEKL